MLRVRNGLAVLAVIAVSPGGVDWASAESGTSTRITSRDQHRRSGAGSYPYRAKSDYVLKELDLRPGDAVVDVGAGDGWWTEKFAKLVGSNGVVYAAEVSKKKVDGMKKRFSGQPQVRPYLCRPDGTGLKENSCDLAFFSQSYHHLPKDGHTSYLKLLRSVVKPTGRLVVIEKYTETGLGAGTHGTRLSRLVRQAEDAGWVPLRLELMTGTYHYIAIFAQKDLFPPEKRRKKGSKKPAKSKVAKKEDNGHTRDSLTTVKKNLADKKAVLVDVREKGEWNSGHLQGATLVPLSRLRKTAKDAEAAKRLTKGLPKKKIIYCHCASGFRVLSAAPLLRKLGFTVRPLAAGYDDLLKAGFPKAGKKR
jgi:rhodanese-related sulfurtransferase/ubiquinone/menaquinone biosynthesis C-methylase UbiE